MLCHVWRFIFFICIDLRSQKGHVWRSTQDIHFNGLHPSTEVTGLFTSRVSLVRKP